jgi:hypothetical protein
MKTAHDLLIKLLPSRSTILRKIPADKRELIGRALIDGEYRTYRDLYHALDIKSYKVSLTAFYNYGRRIRKAAALAGLQRPSIASDGKAHEVLVDALAERMLHAVFDPEEGTPLQLARLSRAYRTTQMTVMARQQSGLSTDLEELPTRKAAEQFDQSPEREPQSCRGEQWAHPMPDFEFDGPPRAKSEDENHGSGELGVDDVVERSESVSRTPPTNPSLLQPKELRDPFR